MKEELLVPLVGAVVVALIAGGISLVLAVLAKDQKTSEFRQAWIDALREDIAKLIGHTSTISILVSLIGVENREVMKEFIVSRQAEFVEIAAIVSRIRLRLNQKEHSKLIKLVSDLDSIKEENGSIDFRVDAVVEESQAVLKSEWNRVKRGEPSYRLLKWVSGLALACSVGGGVWLVAEHFSL